MFDKIRHWLASEPPESRLQSRLELLKAKSPVPIVWLFGRTQSGKTSIIRFLTGAADAEIGQGFRPCTRFSREYQFPSQDAPLLTFLDTRGMDEPSYDPAEDLARFNDLAHVVVVTAKALDHAQENVLKHLRQIRRAKPSRPVLLALTCLHEAYPQQDHRLPYPFDDPAAAKDIPADLLRTLEEQRRRFGPLVDRVVPIDLTRPEEGFAEANYGGEELKKAILDLLPAAYRQTLILLDEARTELRDHFAERALPYLIGYSTLAATAGALPVPWLDLLVLPVIQTRMVYHVGQLYGQQLTAARFMELASTLGLGLLVRQASREISKLIPFAGSVAAGVLAASSTFALGKASCYYFAAVHRGEVPRPEEIREYYKEQLTNAERMLFAKRASVEGLKPGGT